MLYTAEAVSPAHPDKVCDRISDAILDECLRQDPDSRVAIETTGGHGIITITGELTTKAYVDIREIITRIVGDRYGIQINVVKQSPEIAAGVNIGGAGDQGIMVGYACNDNEDRVPQEFYMARKLCKEIYKYHPEDGKVQVTIDDNDNIIAIVCSFNKVNNGKLLNIIMDWLRERNQYGVLSKNLHINPAGDWSVGSFDADAGLTGRKIVVDAYGPEVSVGGGAFSGKDPSKVDRSAAYMARKVALELLKEYKSKKVIVKVAYGIGVVEPIMLQIIIVQNDGRLLKLEPEKRWKERFQPNNIIKELDLKKPIYEKTAEWGAFGDNNFTWNNA